MLTENTFWHGANVVGMANNMFAHQDSKLPELLRFTDALEMLAAFIFQTQQALLDYLI